MRERTTETLYGIEMVTVYCSTCGDWAGFAAKDGGWTRAEIGGTREMKHHNVDESLFQCETCRVAQATVRYDDRPHGCLIDTVGVRQWE